MAYDTRELQVRITGDNADLDKALSSTVTSIRSTGSSISNFSMEASSAFGGVADAMGGILKKGALILAAGSFGLGAATKAAWDQVDGVQQATVALSAYEKNTDKVNGVLATLVKYAQSDMGVLFNRKDLFDAAQGLKTMGDDTDSLAGHVEIMSRSVGLGLSTWDDLSQIVGRVGSTGRLVGYDFDNLTKAGYKLDPALRNTNVTFDSLFKALDKGIPADAMAGQANTIEGIGIRLQTSFRGIGNAILGVDSTSNQFVKGGLGDTLVNTLRQLADTLKDPAIKQGFSNIGKQIGDFAKNAIPVLIGGLKWMLSNMSTLIAILGGLGAAFIAAKVAAIGFSIAATANPIGLIAAAIVGLIAALAFLQLKFDIIGKAIAFLRPVIDPIVAIFRTLFDLLAQQLAPIIQFINEHLDIFKNIAIVLGVVVLGPLVVTIGTLVIAFAAVIAVITFLIGMFNSLIGTFNNVVGWFKIGFQSIISAAFNVGEQIWNAIKGAWDRVMTINWGAVLVNVGRGIGNSIIDLINGAIRGAFSSIPILKDHIPQLPHFASGGIVPGAASDGDNVLIAATAGEMVLNKDQQQNLFSMLSSKDNPVSGGQKVEISLNFNVGMYAGMPVEKRQIALELYKELVRAARSQGVSLPMIGAVGVQ